MVAGPAWAQGGPGGHDLLRPPRGVGQEMEAGEEDREGEGEDEGADPAHPAAMAAAAVAAHAARLFATRPGRVVVPPVLGELRALKALAIRGAGGGVSFHPAAFQRGASACAGLVDLSLTDCGLVSVPHQVAGMGGLTRLDVSGNRGLSSLPPLLAPGVRGLRSLAAASCDLARLPPALTRLTALTSLDLADNPRLQVGGGDAPAPLASARREVALAQLLAALPQLAVLDLRSGPGRGLVNGSAPPKRWSAASLAQLRLVGAPPGYGGDDRPDKGGLLLHHKASGAGRRRGGGGGGGGGGGPPPSPPVCPATAAAAAAPAGALRWHGTLLLPRAAAAPGGPRRAAAGGA